MKDLFWILVACACGWLLLADVLATFSAAVAIVAANANPR